MQKVSDTRFSTASGVILPVVLVIMLIMTLATVALLRTTDLNMVIAGNLAFQRDLVNQADRVVPVATQLFETGVLSAEGVRQNDNAVLNYYASMQATNNRGLPDALFNIALDNANNILVDGIVIRYMIERMCMAAGEASKNSCIYVDSIAPKTGGHALNPINIGTKQYPSYRLSIWVTGPRSGETFVQSIITI